MKKFITMSKEEVIRYTHQIQKERYIIISINNFGEERPIFNKNNNKIKDVLYLFFDEIKQPLLNCSLMTDNDAKNIIDFINKNDNIQNIIIHCTMGISRSVSVRCALEEIFNNRKIGSFVNNTTNKNGITFTLTDILEEKDNNIYILNEFCYSKIKNNFEGVDN